jgi:peptidyl-tRNA hydrolase
MAKRLIDFYDEAKKLGSYKAQMRLALLTQISSVKATTLPDSPENIKIFQKAFEEITKEFKV